MAQSTDFQEKNYPAISVIIPVYNAERTIEKCICLLKKQSLSNIEIICVNDGSSDRTVAILDELKKQDSRIHVLNKENGGAGTARNMALQYSSGEYIAFLDADDQFSSACVLSTLYKKAKEVNAFIVGGSIAGVKQSDFEYNKRHFDKEEIVYFKDYQFDYLFQRFIYSRRLLIDNSIMFPEYRCYEDPVFMLKAMLSAGWFYSVPIDVYTYSGTHHSKLSVDNTIDFLNGLTDNLLLTAKENLGQLHAKLYNRLITAGCYYAETNLEVGKERIVYALVRANAAIDYDLLQNEGTVTAYEERCLPLFRNMLCVRMKYNKIREIVLKPFEVLIRK